MVQIEHALQMRGSHIGLPYWDFIKPMTALPEIVKEETYINPHDHEVHSNPFYNGFVTYKNHSTTRHVDTDLFEQPTVGDHTHIFDAVMLALAQDDYCDFEVQLEVAHNLVHLLVGTDQPFSMATLHYTAYDPLFYLYHSNVDRMWAIWSALQHHRGKNARGYCAWSVINSPLKPFSFDSPLNNNLMTQKHAVPTTVYDYENELHYSYDSLDFSGMSISELDAFLQDRKRVDRVFVGFHLHGVHDSAWAHYKVTR